MLMSTKINARERRERAGTRGNHRTGVVEPLGTYEDDGKRLLLRRTSVHGVLVRSRALVLGGRLRQRVDPLDDLGRQIETDVRQDGAGIADAEHVVQPL